ncbi:hypothetical protein Lal_00015585 [Lupinus albus]|nr:hypothetical protein Lal_00015585 [Lupinus albus]
MNTGIATSSAPKFPVPHKIFSLEIKGNKTEINISSYEDHFLVIATQIGTMGTILHARSAFDFCASLILFMFLEK